MRCNIEPRSIDHRAVTALSTETHMFATVGEDIERHDMYSGLKYVSESKL